MTDDRVGALEALLAEAESAHGVYENGELNGAYDVDWPRWYAQYAVDHGIGAVLGREITVDDLTSVFTTGWAEVQAMEPKPAEPWRTYTARRIAEMP